MDSYIKEHLRTFVLKIMINMPTFWKHGNASWSCMLAVCSSALNAPQHTHTPRWHTYLFLSPLPFFGPVLFLFFVNGHPSLPHNIIAYIRSSIIHFLCSLYLLTNKVLSFQDGLRQWGAREGFVSDCCDQSRSSSGRREVDGWVGKVLIISIENEKRL